MNLGLFHRSISSSTSVGEASLTSYEMRLIGALCLCFEFGCAALLVSHGGTQGSVASRRLGHVMKLSDNGILGVGVIGAGRKRSSQPTAKRSATTPPTPSLYS